MQRQPATELKKQPAIQLQDVGKRFAFTPDRPQSVLESLISVTSRRRAGKSHDLWAVRHVSFNVMPGECVGIVGRNGSGKSTLLKIIARILQPTEGQIAIRGRVSALLELGAGFHPDLTGRENIYLNASVLGLDEAEINRHFDSIVAFSELGEFIDMPVKHYSSGMYMRLGFSVAIHIHPDILIVDEILAVGDQSFQSKCIDRIMEMKRNGVTILIISHDLDTVRTLASRLVWMENGEMRQEGPTDEVAEQYLAQTFQHVANQTRARNASGEFIRWGSRQIELTAVRMLNRSGAETTMIPSGAPFTVELAYTAHEPIEEPEFGLAIHRQDGVHINGPNSIIGGLRLGVVAGSGIVRYEVPALTLVPGTYLLTAAIHDSREPIAYDFHEKAYSFHVVEGESKERDGLVVMPAQWSWENAPNSPQTAPELTKKPLPVKVPQR